MLSALAFAVCIGMTLAAYSTKPDDYCIQQIQQFLQSQRADPSKHPEGYYKEQLQQSRLSQQDRRPSIRSDPNPTTPSSKPTGYYIQQFQQFLQSQRADPSKHPEGYYIKQFQQSQQSQPDRQPAIPIRIIDDPKEDHK